MRGRTLVGRVRSTVLVERQAALAELEAAFAEDSTCAGALLQALAQRGGCGGRRGGAVRQHQRPRRQTRLNALRLRLRALKQKQSS